MSMNEVLVEVKQMIVDRADSEAKSAIIKIRDDINELKSKKVMTSEDGDVYIKFDDVYNILSKY